MLLLIGASMLFFANGNCAPCLTITSQLVGRYLGRGPLACHGPGRAVGDCGRRRGPVQGVDWTLSGPALPWSYLVAHSVAGVGYGLIVGTGQCCARLSDAVVVVVP